MRTRQWLKTLLSGCLAVAGGLTAHAQEPPFQQFGPGNPDAVGMLPPPYNTNYGAAPQSYTGMEQAGYPPGANPWPNVSPYMGPAVDQTTYENGTWFNQQLSGRRQYYFSTEALIGRTNVGSGALVGAHGVNIHPVIPGQISANQQFFASTSFATNLNSLNRFVVATGGGGGGGTSTGQIHVFTPRDYNQISNPDRTGGLRTTWGWFNPDQTGFQLSAFWLNNTIGEYNSGLGLRYDPTLSFVPGYDNQFIRALTGIPLQGPDSDGDRFPGVVQPFDLYYRLRFESQIMGTNLDWYGTPIVDRQSMKIRPIVGVRYINLIEQFAFNGADTGMGYSIRGATAQTGGNSATATGGVLAPVAFDPLFSVPDVMQSQLLSRTQTQLLGPEAGLRLDLGGDSFKIWTQTKVGLLGNNATRKLSGFNIGDAYYAANGRTIPIMPRDDSAATAFSSRDTTSFLSPMFEQSIFMKNHPFENMPIMRKSSIMRAAEFQAGYTFLVLGSVYRPAQTINWQAFPVNPQLQDRRTTYTNGTFSFGVEWAY